MKKRSFAEIMDRFLGKPYSLNGYGPDSYGCFGLIYAYLQDLGLPLPRECRTTKGSPSFIIFDHSGRPCEVINGGPASTGGRWAIENYGDLILADLRLAEDVMIAVLTTIGAETGPALALAGDVLVVRHNRTHGLFPAVHIGNGYGMAAFINGSVASFSLRDVGRPVMVRRVRRA